MFRNGLYRRVALVGPTAARVRARSSRTVRVEVVAPFVTQIDVWHRALRAKLRDDGRGIVLLTKVVQPLAAYRKSIWLYSFRLYKRLRAMDYAVRPRRIPLAGTDMRC